MHLINNILRSCTMKAFMVFLMALVIIGGLLVYNGNARFNGFRMVGELPGVFNYYLFRRHVKNRDFEKAVYFLSMQLDYVQFVSKGNNHILKGLLKNIKYCIEHAKTDDEYDSFQSFLDRFVSLYPNIHISRVWYAQTLRNDSPEVVFEQIDAAADLVASDPQLYRIGIDVARKYSLEDKLSEYCDKYKTEQLGGLASLDNDLLFYGIGLRVMALEVVGESGDHVYAENNGLRLIDKAEYEFSLEKPMDLTDVKLHLASHAGVMLQFHKVLLRKNGRIVMELLPEDMFITSINSYFVNENTIMIADGKESEVISLGLPASVAESTFDNVTLVLGFARGGVTNNGRCTQFKSDVS